MGFQAAVLAWEMNGGGGSRSFAFLPEKAFTELTRTLLGT